MSAVHSANRRLTIPFAVGLSVALAGCVSTQTKNARLVTENERILDTQSSVRVTGVNPEVAVAGIALVRTSSGAAIAVSLHNLASHPLSDLPISVGITRHQGARHYLNGKANLGYFDTHIAALGPSVTTTWVLPLGHAALPTGHPFAEVGYAHVPASTSTRTLPPIEVSRGVGAEPGGLQVTVNNRSAVPQTLLPVYAVARRAGHLVAAGRATIGELSGDTRRTLRLELLGTSTGATVDLFASPTIFK